MQVYYIGTPLGLWPTFQGKKCDVMLHIQALFKYDSTDRNGALCRVVCSRWARADRGTPLSNRCKATSHDRHRSADDHDTRYRRRQVRL